MKYVKPNREHILKLIDWIYNEVLSSGGDGDCLWVSKYYDVKDILPLITEYNDKLKYKWTIAHNDNKKEIQWGDNQEGIVITNHIESYKTSPDWQQCIIVT